MSSVKIRQAVETTRVLAPRKRTSKVTPHAFVPSDEAHDPYCNKCGLVSAHEAHDLREFEIVGLAHTVREVLT